MSTRRSLFRAGVLVVALVALGATSAWAQTPNPTFADGSVTVTVIGQTVRVRVTANQLDDANTRVNPDKVEVGLHEFTAIIPGSSIPVTGATEMEEQAFSETSEAVDVTFTGLKAGQVYLVGWRGVKGTAKQAWAYPQGVSGGNSTSTSVTASFVETQGTPTTTTTDVIEPVKVSLTSVGRDSIKIAWVHGKTTDNKDDGTRIKYEVGWTDAGQTTDEFSTSLSPQVVLTVSGGRSATEHTLASLPVGKSYLAAVRAVAGDTNGKETGKSDWVYDERPVTQNPHAPRQMTPAAATQPQNVQVMAGDRELMVQWNEVATVGTCKNAVAGAKPCGYRVEWRAANQSYDNPDRQEDLTGVDLDTEYTITGLTNGTEYYVVVSSRNERSASFSAKSTEARATPMADESAAPDAPTVTMAEVGWDWTIDVEWTAVSDATGYKVEWRTASQNYGVDGQMANLAAGATSYTIDDDLQPDTTYMVRVSAMSAGGSAASDDVSVGMPTQITEKPTVTVTPGDKMLTVEWTAVTGATDYCLAWEKSPAVWHTSADCTGSGTFRSQGERTYVIKEFRGQPLVNGTEYDLIVWGRNDAGSGPNSDAVTAMPMMPTPALPVFGALVLGAGLVTAGRRRLRARQRRLLKA